MTGKSLFPLFGLALALCVPPAQGAASPASAAAAQLRSQVSHQLWNQQMARVHFNGVYPQENLEVNLNSEFTVYGKDSIVASGIGTLQTEKASFLRGPRRSVLLMEGRRNLPDFTDSVISVGISGTRTKGIPFGDNWLFIEQRGAITVYSGGPGEALTHFSLGDGEIRELKDHRADLLAELGKIPLAVFFLGRSPLGGGMSDVRPEYVIQIYNNLYEKNPPLEKPGTFHHTAMAGAFMADSLTEWTYSNLVFSNPGDFMESSVRAKYLCGTGKAAAAAHHIQKLEAMLPGMYSTYQIKGLCAQTSGDIRKALYFYHLAYMYAPAAMVNPYYAKIRKYKKILGE